MLDSPTPPDPAPAQPFSRSKGHTDKPFVGRDIELAEFTAGLDATLTGSGRLFLISGEPGIGKTRLATEYARIARSRGALVCWGRCWEAGAAPPYWPWVEVIRELLKSPACPTLTGLGRITPCLAQLVPELQEDCVDTLERSHPSEPDSARFALFDAVARFLGYFANTQPVAILLDDLQAADRSSLLLLSFLVRALTDQRMLFVGTYRTLEPTTATDIVEPLANLGRRAVRQQLDGLSLSEVTHLVELIAGQAVTRSVSQSIHAATDGNPFFVGEIVSLCRATLTQGGSNPCLPIPESVRQALYLRLRALPDSSRRLLEVAAVLGRDFDPSVVAAATGTSVASVLLDLSDSIAQGLIVSPPPAAERLSFRHALIRDLIYGDLMPADRLALHHRIAQTLETLSRSDPDCYAAELAHHFLSSAPVGDDRFLLYGLRAAQRALSRMAFAEAASLYQRVLASLVHLPPNDRRRCEILLALGEAKDWAADGPGARKCFEEAAEIARRLDARDLFVRAALGVGSGEAMKYTAATRCSSVPELLHEALTWVGRDDPAARARLLSRLALERDSIDRLAFSADATSEARRSGDGATIALALTARHGVLLGPDHLEERCAIAEEMLSLARSLPSTQIAMRAHALRAHDSVESGDISGALDALQGHERLCNATHDPFETWANLSWRSLLALFEGSFDTAEQLTSRAYELVQNVPGTHALESNGPLVHLLQTLFTDIARGHGITDLSTLVDWARRYPESCCWRTVRLHALFLEGRPDEMSAELDVLGAYDFEDFGRDSSWLAAMAFIAEAIAATNDRTRAAKLYPLLLPFKDRNVTIGMVASFGSASRALGLLAATLGNWDESAVYFEHAIEMNTRMRALPWIAIASHDYARCLERRPDRQSRVRVEALEGRVLAIAKELGMQRLLHGTAVFGHEEGAPCARRIDENDGRPRFRRCGEFWLVTYAGHEVHLRDAKGLSYIAELVRLEGREVHVLELLRLHAPVSVSESPGVITPSAYDTRSEAILDKRAQREYRQRLARLRLDFEHATVQGNAEDATLLREEVQSLERELRRSVGLRGRVRRNSLTERARVNVTRAIRLSLSRIVDVAPQLGSHLAERIKTGTFCSYGLGDPYTRTATRRALL